MTVAPSCDRFGCLTMCSLATPSVSVGRAHALPHKVIMTVAAAAAAAAAKMELTE